MKTSEETPRIARRYVETSAGVIHIAIAGKGFPVLLLHQTPRSWDEYRDVLPLLGKDFQAIAMDTAGFGDSCRLPLQEHSIERWAAIAFELLDRLSIDSAAIVGHHTGAVTAMEMAASRPARVAALVLSSCPYNDAARRELGKEKRTIDAVSVQEDGGHLTELWARRRPFYPAGRPDLLERFIVDALKAGEMASHGHAVVRNYLMETRISSVSSPCLVVQAASDPHAAPYASRVAQDIAGSKLVSIEDGMVPLPDQLPEKFARTVSDFLKSLGR